MSHLAENDIQQNCRFSRHARNGWQYGQPFPKEDFFNKQREFLVDRIECHEQAIIVNASLDDKRKFRREDTGDGIHVFKKRKCPDNISKNEFKYRIKCSDTGKWTCTCEHFQNNATACCKHINACIDTTLWKEGDKLIINERGLLWRPYTTTYDFGNDIRYKYPGYTDIVTKIEPTSVQNAESQFHQFVSGHFYKISNSRNYHSFNK